MFKRHSTPQANPAAPVLQGREREEAIRHAQVQGIFASGLFAYTVNGTASLSIAIIYYFGDKGHSPWIMAWALFNAALLAVRALIQIRLEREAAGIGSQRILRILTVSSLLGGLTWSALPFGVPGIDMAGTQSYITLFLVGMACGELVRGVPNATLTLAFSLPPVLAVALMLMADGTLMAYILGINVAILAHMLYRSCSLGAANFIDNAVMKLEATLLAQSLQEANRDIREANRVLEQLATCDPLTGLANRSKFNTALAEALSREGAGQTLALLLFDLDRFKVVNDTLGHAAGDSLLVHVASRLSAALDGKALAARLGGDEFAVICPTTGNAEEAMALAERCLAEICMPVMLAGRKYGVEASIGIALAPDHGATPDALFASADRALYRAKAAGRRCAVVFSADMREREERQARIELDLHDALVSGAVEAWFQPQVQLSDGKLVGVEALVRWNHPVLGPLNAQEIIEAVHARRLHGLLTEVMAENACALLHALRKSGLPGVGVAINVSAEDFMHYNVPDLLAGIVARHAIDPALVEIELTEEALLDVDLHGAELAKLEGKGFRLALDDFGMGSTSLSYLRTISIDRLKIDRDFVSGISESRHNQALVTAMVALGRMLDLDILVEGVETDEDRSMLRMLGCQSAQGWLYARAMPADQLLAWMRERHLAA